MKKVFHIFKIQKEERWLALIIFALLAILNGLVIAKYNAPFTQITNDYYKISFATSAYRDSIRSPIGC